MSTQTPNKTVGANPEKSAFNADNANPVPFPPKQWNAHLVSGASGPAGTLANISVHALGYGNQHEVTGLIAAAPELLAACEMIEWLCPIKDPNQIGNTIHGITINSEQIAELRAAIAKATGAQS